MRPASCSSSRLRSLASALTVRVFCSRSCPISEIPFKSSRQRNTASASPYSTKAKPFGTPAASRMRLTLRTDPTVCSEDRENQHNDEAWTSPVTIKCITSNTCCSLASLRAAGMPVMNKLNFSTGAAATSPLPFAPGRFGTGKFCAAPWAPNPARGGPLPPS